MKQKHSVAKLERLMNEDLEQCHTKTERGNVEAICGIKIRRRAEELAAAGQLTQHAAEIAARHGYRGVTAK